MARKARAAEAEPASGAARPHAAAEARLAAVRTRGEVKALGAACLADPELHGALVALAEARGIPVDDATGKQLVRRLLDRADAAQVRTNPIHRDEAFRCAHCDRDVPPGRVAAFGREHDGRAAQVRDHCPWCLRGRHLDVVPGDRAADCGGVLDPVAFERRPELVIRYRCRQCGHAWSVRAHPDDRVPPSLDPRDIPGG